jgi:hypothetical protein
MMMLGYFWSGDFSVKTAVFIYIHHERSGVCKQVNDSSGRGGVKYASLFIIHHQGTSS